MNFVKKDCFMRRICVNLNNSNSKLLLNTQLSNENVKRLLVSWYLAWLQPQMWLEFRVHNSIAIMMITSKTIHSNDVVSSFWQLSFLGRCLCSNHHFPIRCWTNWTRMTMMMMSLNYLNYLMQNRCSPLNWLVQPIRLKSALFPSILLTIFSIVSGGHEPFYAKQLGNSFCYKSFALPQLYRPYW